jgi:4,5-dihydroxyphthalate decarboxylase
VVVDEEHVQEYRKPSNVEERPGANLGQMLARGELAAAIGVGQVDSPDVRPLIPNAREAEAAWYRKTGIYPINHTVVVKDSLLRADPTLAPRLYAAFTEAKAGLLKQFAAGAPLAADAQALAQRRAVVGDDPLPYGVAPNRRAIEAVIRFAHDQKILPGTVAVEDVFWAPPGDRERTR